MYDENQIVQVKWERGNKRRYESLGYTYTKIGDILNVRVKDLARNAKVRITATCDYCGEEYTTLFGNLIRSREKINKDACIKCKKVKASEATVLNSSKRIIPVAAEICKKNGYELLTTEEEYTGIRMTARICCKKHGEQNVTLQAILNSGAGCPKCANERVGARSALDKDYVKHYIDSINGNELLNKEDYKSTKVYNLNIRCSCGNIFTTSFDCYARGVQRCYSCSCRESLREREIRILLENYKIEFIQEHKFEDCRDLLPLPFDFYLPDYNLCIEFDGQHHYEPVFGEKHYKSTVKHDKIKNQYCEDNNINLLRIPYWEGNNIEDIISKQLNL